MADIYRVVFEAVRLSALHKYCNADPAFFKNVTQLVPNSEIPDEHWDEVTGVPTDNPWQQFNQLRKWQQEDREFVRNVRLQRMVGELQFEDASCPDDPNPDYEAESEIQ